MASAFVAGTQVVVRIDAEGNVSTHMASHDSYLGNVILSGALMFVGIQGRKKLLRNRREDEEETLDEAFAEWTGDDLPPDGRKACFKQQGRRELLALTVSAKCAVADQTSAPVAVECERSSTIAIGCAAPILALESDTSRPVRKPRTRLRSVLAMTWLCAFLSFAGWFGYRALPDNVAAKAFASETPVAVASKPRYVTKNIEEVQPGDTILAMDPISGRLRSRPVLQTFVRTADHLQRLTLADATGHSQTLDTTDEHPFWSADRRAWIVAEDLQPNERVLGPSGETQHIRGNVREEHPEGLTVYNFEVDDFHSYFVAADVENLPLLVHNAGKKYKEPPFRTYEKKIQDITFKENHSLLSRPVPGRKPDVRKPDSLSPNLEIAVEAKHTQYWPNAFLNPNRLSTARNKIALQARARFLKQVRTYLASADEVHVYTNSQEMIDHWKVVFKNCLRTRSSPA